MDALYVGDNFEVRKVVVQHFLRDGSGCDSTYCLARRRTPAALPIADSILGLIGVIGVRGAKRRLHFTICFRPGILVPHHERNRRSEGETFKNPGKNLAFILFSALRNDLTLTWPPAVEIKLNILCSQGNSRRATIHNCTDTATVRFTPSCNPKQTAKKRRHV